MKFGYMIISFNAKKEIAAPGMNNGTGMMTIRMYTDKRAKCPVLNLRRWLYWI